MELCNESTLQEYTEFVKGHPKGHFMQDRSWGYVKDNWLWEGLISRDSEGKIRGVMSVLVRKVPIYPCTLMYSPRGPVCDLHDKETLTDLINGAKELAKKHKAYVLKLDTDTKSDDKEYEEIVKGLGFQLKTASKNFEGIQPRYVFRLYLNGRTEEEVMASFHSKTRYNIRVAIKKGVEVKIMDKSSLPDFHRIMMETGVRDGFVIRSQEYFEMMMDKLGENCRLYMAYLDGKPIAGTLAILYGDKVWYLYGASSNEYRNVMPNYLLQWEMIRWAIQNNCRVYDFRGVSGDISEDNPLYGLYRFKKGFNGEFTEFIGEMDLVFSPMLNVLVNKSQRAFRSLRRTMFLFKNRK